MRAALSFDQTIVASIAACTAVWRQLWSLWRPSITSTWTASISTASKRQRIPCCTFSCRRLAAGKRRVNGHRLSTQLPGTGGLTEGMAWDDQAKNPAGSRLSGTARDTSGRSQLLRCNSDRLPRRRLRRGRAPAHRKPQGWHWRRCRL